MPLCLYWKDDPYISNARCLLEASIERIWPKNLCYSHNPWGRESKFKYSNFENQHGNLLVHEGKKSMPPPTKFTTFIQQKKEHCLLLLSLWIFGYTHQLSEPELFKIKQRLLHHPIRAPIIVCTNQYYSFYGSVKLVLIVPLNQILMKGQLLTSDI